jgi:hypothetical protein
MNESINNELSLRWSSHPLKKNVWVSILVIVFLFAIWLAVYLTTGNPLLLALSVAIMLGSLSSFFLPTRYELDDDKVKIIYLISMRERKWGTFRSYYVDKNGILLSPFERPSRLENFRGLYIRFNHNKDQVVDFVKSKIAKKHDG